MNSNIKQIKPTTYFIISMCIATKEHLYEEESGFDIFTFLLCYSFLLNDATKPQNSRVQKTSQLNAPQGNIYMGARYLDPKYSRWISTDPALGEYIPAAGKGNSENAGNLPGMGGIYNHINGDLYHYAGNNPVRYVDPDGRDIVNSTDKYIIARLEKPLNKGKSNEIDTLIIPPHSIAYGAFDGARDEDGNYYKISAHELSPAIDFEIDGNNDLKIGGLSKILNDFGDSYKMKKDKDKPDDEKRILSGKKTKGISPDYEKLKNSWEQTFIEDVGDNGTIGNSESWASKYNDKAQIDLRKKYKIQTFDEIQKFDEMMHAAHIY